MREAATSSWVAVGGIVSSSAIICLMLYRAIAFSGGNAALELSELGWLVLVTGVACLVLSVAMLAYMRHLAPTPPAPQAAPEAAPEALDGPKEEPMTALEQTEARSERLLGGLKEDERRLYNMISDRGGEVLQRDLVASGEFSKAKVTRLLDKLEGRELIKRERHGMTNMVKLIR